MLVKATKEADLYLSEAIRIIIVHTLVRSENKDKTGPC